MRGHNAVLMRLLLISSSNVHGYGYLDHAEPYLRDFLGAIRRVAFVPFAMRDRDGYTARVRERLARMSIETLPLSALDDAEAIFVGGGNTFRLLETLYETGLFDVVRDRVRSGIPYIGSSAGTNIACPTIKTTNDMPVIWPRSPLALGLVPFQINPHYLDPDPASTHMGETREERIREFLEENDAPVIGLREGAMLRVEGDVVTLAGTARARVFRRGAEPEEVEPGTRIVL
jgi:dipeptidase E